MSELAGPRHFPPMAGQTYELGPMTLAFKPTEVEVDGVYSMRERMRAHRDRLRVLRTTSEQIGGVRQGF